MPELPEVETIIRRLHPALTGKVISQVEVHHQKSFLGNSAALNGASILSLRRRGKIIIIELSTHLCLFIHLKMTGQLIYVDGATRLGGGHPSPDWVRDLPSKHTRVTFAFSDNTTLFFNDQRLFGWCKTAVPKDEVVLFSNYGPDVTDTTFTPDYFFKKLYRRTISIKQALMMNGIVAGIGNIYANDALHIASISPFRPASSLTKTEIERLHAACVDVINIAIAAGGTTFDGMFVDSSGLAGRYQEQARVYGKQGQQCQVCGSTIMKTMLGGRGTYYCPTCQL